MLVATAGGLVPGVTWQQGAGCYIQLNIQITTFHSHVQTRNQEGKEGQEFPLFMLAEAIYMSWFTFELLVRLVS